MSRRTRGLFSPERRWFRPGRRVRHSRSSGARALQLPPGNGGKRRGGERWIRRFVSRGGVLVNDFTSLQTLSQNDKATLVGCGMREAGEDESGEIRPDADCGTGMRDAGEEASREISPLASCPPSGFLLRTPHRASLATRLFSPVESSVGLSLP